MRGLLCLPIDAIKFVLKFINEENKNQTKGKSAFYFLLLHIHLEFRICRSCSPKIKKATRRKPRIARSVQRRIKYEKINEGRNQVPPVYDPQTIALAFPNESSKTSGTSVKHSCDIECMESLSYVTSKNRISWHACEDNLKSSR